MTCICVEMPKFICSHQKFIYFHICIVSIEKWMTFIQVKSQFFFKIDNGFFSSNLAITKIKFIINPVRRRKWTFWDMKKFRQDYLIKLRLPVNVMIWTLIKFFSPAGMMRKNTIIVQNEPLNTAVRLNDLYD